MKSEKYIRKKICILSTSAALIAFVSILLQKQSKSTCNYNLCDNQSIFIIYFYNESCVQKFVNICFLIILIGVPSFSLESPVPLFHHPRLESFIPLQPVYITGHGDLRLTQGCSCVCCLGTNEQLCQRWLHLNKPEFESKVHFNLNSVFLG